MPSVNTGGLSGKARYVRYRNRASRLHSRHLMDEYDDYVSPPPDRHPAESIPIRGRADFLPSVAHTDQAQLELPLQAAKAEVKAADATKVQDATDRVIRFPRSKRENVSIPLKPPTQFRRKATFTWRGFFTGCAMGGAAAAAFLLVIRTVVG